MVAPFGHFHCTANTAISSNMCQRGNICCSVNIKSTPQARLFASNPANPGSSAFGASSRRASPHLCTSPTSARTRCRTKLEPDLFLTVTGLTVKDFHLLVSLRVFNTEQMNQAVFAFRRYEDASLRYTGIDSHPGLTHYGLYDTVVARE